MTRSEPLVRQPAAFTQSLEHPPRGLTCLLAVVLATGLSAQTTVTTTSGGTGGPECTLRDAIQAADRGRAVGGCIPGGSGERVVILQPGATYTLSEIDNVHPESGPNGLPSVLNHVIIEGNGATIERSTAPGTPEFRFMTAAELSVFNLTFRNGHASLANNVNVTIDFESFSLGDEYPGTSISELLPSNSAAENYEAYPSLVFGSFDPEDGDTKFEIFDGAPFGSTKAVCPAIGSVLPRLCEASLNIVFKTPAKDIRFDLAGDDSTRIDIIVSLDDSLSNLAYASATVDGEVLTPEHISLANLSFFDRDFGAGNPVTVTPSTAVFALAVDSASDPAGVTYDNISFTLITDPSPMCSLDERAGAGNGGALLIQNFPLLPERFAALSLDNVTFEDNRSLCSGGAVHALMDLGSVWIRNSRFARNSASTELQPFQSPTGRGGALLVQNAALFAWIDNTEFLENDAFLGGAVAVQGQPLFQDLFGWEVEASSFRDNHATGDGGAAWLDSARLWISDTELLGNRADDSGGAIAFAEADLDGPSNDLTVLRTAIAGNRALAGGGVAMAGSLVPGGASLTMAHSTVSGNVASVGGGILNEEGTLRVFFSTVTDNSAMDGAGIAAADGTSIGTELWATIVAKQREGSDCRVGGTWTSLGSNLDSDGTCQLGPDDLSSVDPILDRLGDNGGPTETHALLLDSPAIDAVEPSLPAALIYGEFCGSCGADDQRGVRRPQGSRADIGSFETACTDGEARSCYSGPEGTENVGICRSGTRLCVGCAFDEVCRGEIVPATDDSICDGLDNDCDGVVDEEFAATSTTCGVGVCAGNTGLETCQDGAAVDSCDPFEGAATDDSVCDGLDNDCDGVVDEEFAATSTTCGVGVCAGNTGFETCQDGAAVDSCNPFEGAATDDSICDGLDNDCDGVVDEEFAATPTTCGVGVCAGNTGFETCQGGAVVDSCNPFEGAAIDGLVCDGLDNDCDGLVDENCIADCSGAVPSTDRLWPPNHAFAAITVEGVFDPRDDRLSIEVTGIFQDEPVDTYGDGSFVPDGRGLGTDTAHVRAERSGTPRVPGDGRVYHIRFSVRDDTGGMCTGTVSVGVPHDRPDTPVDGGALYNSTVP